ncbi:MAG: hypothetical protein ACK49N_14330 [Verrucomicrobiota bacterium]
MKRKRRHLTAEFKARIAAEALKGEKSSFQPTGSKPAPPSLKSSRAA